MAADDGVQRGHIKALDSLRGLAALAVVLHHLLLLGPPRLPRWVWGMASYSPWEIVVQGRQPVILFFVLSGFVLAHALLEGRAGYGVFLARRFSRIYPPFAAAILLSGLAALWLAPPAGGRPFGVWFATLWAAPPDAAAVLDHLLMPGTGRDDLDPVIWSLVHELRISAVLPLLLLAARRSLPLLLAAGLIGQWIAVPYAVDAGTAAACVDWLHCRPYWGTSLTGSLLVTLYFVPFFVLGIGLALHRPLLRHGLASLPRGSSLLLLIAALALLSLARTGGDLAFGVGAVMLIGLVLERGWIARPLLAPPLLWLGRISYSLYLIHVPVFLAVTYALHDRLGTAVAALLLPASLAAAWLLHLAVEEPARRLGRRLSAAHPAPPRASSRARA